MAKRKNTKNVEIDKYTEAMRSFVERNATLPQILEYGDGDKKLNVTVNPMLPFTQRANLVRDIADMVFMGERNTIDQYSPEYIKLAQRYNVIKYYTDFQLPEDVDTMWLVLNYTPLYQDVKQCVGSDLDDILKEADELIKTKRDYIVNKTDFTAFMEKISQSLDSLGTQFSSQDISKIVDVLKNMPNMSTEGVVDAILKTQEKQEK